MPRASSGCAAFSAAWALAPLPDAMASSTLRRKVRIRERRALFTALRATDWRARSWIGRCWPYCSGPVVRILKPRLYG